MKTSARLVTEGPDAGKIEIGIGNSRFYPEPEDARLLVEQIDNALIANYQASSR